jgi:hypothetical protein
MGRSWSRRAPRRDCLASRRDGSWSRTRHLRSWSAPWIPSRASGSSTSVQVPGGRRLTSRASSGRTGRWWRPTSRPRAWASFGRPSTGLSLQAALLVQDGRRPPCGGVRRRARRRAVLGHGLRATPARAPVRVGKDELSGLARLQVGIATAAAGLLRPGGRLIYSVCTFPRAETDAACDALLRRRPELLPLPLEGPDGPAERLRLWPTGTDATRCSSRGSRAGSGRPPEVPVPTD